MIDDRRTPDQIASRLTRKWQIDGFESVRDMFNLPTFRISVSSESRITTIGMLLCGGTSNSRGHIDLRVVLEKCELAQLDVGYPDDALRFMEAYPDTCFVNSGRLNLNIVFLNRVDPSASLEIGFDGMCCPFFRRPPRSPSPDSCFAIRTGYAAC